MRVTEIRVGGRDGTQRCRRAGLHAELLEHMLEMLLDRAGADRQQRRDLAVRLSRGDQSENVALARSEWKGIELTSCQTDALLPHQQVTALGPQRIGHKMDG